MVFHTYTHISHTVFIPIVRIDASHNPVGTRHGTEVQRGNPVLESIKYRSIYGRNI